MRTILLALLLACGASAYGQTYCTNGQCRTSTTYGYTSYVPSTHSAQGVAEMMASRGVMQHFGNPTGGYEGVGMGSTPEAALGRCCYSNSGMRVVDQGVACGRNGRWYACKRYR